jgi:hypothetical protein
MKLWTLSANLFQKMDIMKDNTHSQHMKTAVILGLCILLGAGFISARAADNPAQAAARAVLLQKLYELDHPQTSVPLTPAQAPVQTPIPAPAPTPAPSMTPSMTPAQDALPGIVVPHRHIRETA